MRRSYQSIELCVDLAQKLKPTEVTSGIYVSGIEGQLTARDNKYRIQVCILLITPYLFLYF